MSSQGISKPFRFGWFGIRRFQTQLALLIVGAVSLGAILMAFFTSQQQSAFVRQSIQATVEALSQNLSLEAADHLLAEDYADLQITLQHYVRLPDILSVQVVNAYDLPIGHIIREEGAIKTLYSIDVVDLPEALSALYEENQYIAIEDSVKGSITIWRPIEVANKLLGYSIIEMSLESIALIKSQLWRDSLTFSIVFLLSFLALLLFFLRKPIKVIEEASQFAASLDQHLGEELAVNHFSTEFEALGRSLNQVSQKLYEQEKLLVDQSERLNAILTHAVDGIITLNANLEIVSVNPAAERLFDYKAQELIGQKGQLLFDAPISFLSKRRIAQSQKTTLSGKRNDGSTFPLELANSQVSLEDQVFYVAIARDMTERMNYEAELKRREAEARKLSWVASRTSNAVVITDADGYVEWVNEGFTRITGYIPNEVMGKKPGALLQGPETNPNVVAAMRKQIKAAKPVKTEILNYTKTGEAYWIEVEIQPIFSDSGQLLNFIAIESDITERKKIAIELQQAVEAADTANKAKSEFLSRMSHELRTPLNAILGFGQILELDDLDETELDSVQHILRAGKHLLGLIEEVMDISRIEAGNMSFQEETVNLPGIIQEASSLVAIMAEDKNISVTLDFLDIEHLVQGDPQRYKQIWINLLTNSIKYNRSGGTVCISYQNLSDETCEYLIKDSGFGIAEEKLPRLFMPFDRLGAEGSDIQGSGLGLSLTKSLIESMGGNVRVVSKVDQGTSFFLQLPRSKKQHKVMVADYPENPIERNFLNDVEQVVYIEDNDSNIAVVKKVLEQHSKLELFTAKTAEAGLELVHSVKPSVILLDLNLPQLGGDGLVKILQEDPLLSTIPVIILSADATQERVAELIEQGVFAYLSKPLQVSELLITIDEALKTIERPVFA